MLHRLFYHVFYWLETDRGMKFVFKSVQLFVASSGAKFPVQTSGWTERLKQVHRNCLILYCDNYSLNCRRRFLFHKLNFVAVMFCVSDTDTIQNTKNNYFDLGKIELIV